MSDGVRCYIRYSNSGKPYRICNDGGKPTPKKPPSKITPAIDPSEFAEKYGGYGKLTKEQEKTYHRLYMRKQREEENKLKEGGEDYKKLINATKQQEKEEKKLKKLKGKQDKLTKKMNKRKFKEALKNLAPAERNILTIKKLKDKYNITDEVANNIKQTTDKIKETESNLETLEEKIKDGKKVVIKQLGGQTNKKYLLEF